MINFHLYINNKTIENELNEINQKKPETFRSIRNKISITNQFRELPRLSAQNAISPTSKKIDITLSRSPTCRVPSALCNVHDKSALFSKPKDTSFNSSNEYNFHSARSQDFNKNYLQTKSYGRNLLERLGPGEMSY